MPKRDFRGSKRRRRGKGTLQYAKKRRKGSKLTKIFTDLYSGSTTKGTKEPGKGAGTTVKAGYEDQAAGIKNQSTGKIARIPKGEVQYKEVSGVVSKLTAKRKKRKKRR